MFRLRLRAWQWRGLAGIALAGPLDGKMRPLPGPGSLPQVPQTPPAQLFLNNPAALPPPPPPASPPLGSVGLSSAQLLFLPGWLLGGAVGSGGSRCEAGGGEGPRPATEGGESRSLL